MKKLVFVYLIVLGGLFPVAAFADPSMLDKPRPQQIQELAGKIMATDFKPLIFSVEASSKEEALLQVVAQTSEYLKSCNLCCLMSLCLDTEAFATELRYSLLKFWAKDFTVIKNAAGEVEYNVKLSSKQLTQLALFNLWPLFIENLKV
jgi:hypothetical protein